MTPSTPPLGRAHVRAAVRPLLGLAMAAGLAVAAAAPAAAQGDAAGPSGDPGAPPAGTSVGPAPTWSNVLYAETSPSQVLDLWIPETGEAPYPLVVFVHGGAFMMGDKAMDIAHIADVLDAGYAAAGVNYRLSGEALFPAAVQDVKAAVRFLRANADEYGLDPEILRRLGRLGGRQPGVHDRNERRPADHPGRSDAGQPRRLQRRQGRRGLVPARGLPADGRPVPGGLPGCLRG